VLTPSTAGRILELCYHQTPGWILNQGYVWYRTRFEAALEVYEKTYEADDLYRDSLFTALTVQDLLDAPRQATNTGYRLAEIFPEDGIVYLYLAELLARVGRSAEAVEAWENGLRLCGEPPEWAYPPKDYLREYVEGDPIWEISELLIRYDPERALKVLEGRRGLRIRLARARALGALGDDRGVLEEWGAISRLKSPLQLDGSDWFYLPLTVYNSPQFWQLLLEIDETRYLPGGVWSFYQGLSAYGPDCVPRLRSEAWQRWELQSRRLGFQYELARTIQDAEAANQLAALYPEWTDAVELAEKL